MLWHKKIKLTKDDIMNSIPLKNESLEYEKNEQGETVVIMKRKFTWWLKILSKLFYLSDRKIVTLDELGTEVLNMCDERISFRNMVDRFSRNYKLNLKEAETSIMAYLKSLSERRIVALAIKAKNDDNRNTAKN